MKIVIPMAGRGSRFREVGILTPKPLIEVKGKPMVSWSIETVKRIYPQARESDFIFICLQEHEDEYQISKKLKEIAGEKINLIFVSEVTAGPACTVLLAKKMINVEEDLLICDCDQFFVCPDFVRSRAEAIKNKWGGMILTAESKNPGYSYIRLDKKGNAVKTAEKKLISTHAATGAYYFTQGKNFVRSAERMIKQNLRTKNEFYICPTYNQLIKRGDVVRIVSTVWWTTIGTPAEAQFFTENVPQKYLQKETRKKAKVA